MLSDDEQRAWDALRRRCEQEVEEPARPGLDLRIRRQDFPASDGLAATVVAGFALAVMLVIIGAPVAGLAVAVATVPRWVLRRHRPPAAGTSRGPHRPGSSDATPRDDREEALP
jgi:hypothetical protein